MTLPFNAFWDKTKLHPNGAIDLSYSDDLGKHWVKGNIFRRLAVFGDWFNCATRADLSTPNVAPQRPNFRPVTGFLDIRTPEKGAE